MIRHVVRGCLLKSAKIREGTMEFVSPDERSNMQIAYRIGRLAFSSRHVSPSFLTRIMAYPIARLEVKPCTDQKISLSVLLGKWLLDGKIDRVTGFHKYFAMRSSTNFQQNLSAYYLHLELFPSATMEPARL